MALKAPDRGTLFTRGELAEAAGIQSGVAAFWIKRGLLLPQNNRGGRGTHLRFERMQVSIAAVLSRLQSFGLNIAALKSFSDILQHGVAIGERLQVDASHLWAAARLSKGIAEFNAGHPITYDGRNGETPRPARNLNEVAESLAWGYPDKDNKYFLDLASRINPADFDALNLYVAFLEEMDKPHPHDGATILLWQTGELWSFTIGSINGGMPLDTRVAAGFYLDLKLIISSTWSIDQHALEHFFEERRQQFMSKRQAEIPAAHNHAE